MSEAPTLAPVQAPPIWLTRWQLGWLGFQLIILAGCGTTAWLMQPEQFPLLWTDALGRQLLVQAAGLLILNFLAVIVGGVILNLTLGRYFDFGVPYVILAILLQLTCSILFFMPMLFVLLDGPSAIRIARTLAL